MYLRVRTFGGDVLMWWIKLCISISFAAIALLNAVVTITNPIVILGDVLMLLMLVWIKVANELD